MFKAIRWILLALILVGGIFLLSGSLPSHPIRNAQQQPTESREPQLSAKPSKPFNTSIQGGSTVSRVIDGDTIELSTGDRVRYIGINTPETVDPRKPAEAYGKEAKEFNQKLVEGQQVRIESDVQDRDKYGRLLRYVYLLDGTFVNKKLVEEGYAYATSYPPNVKYDLEFRGAQQQAREQKKGLWGDIVNASAPSCTIKGNISANGEKIYHLPGMAFYNKTVIDESKGERWFCSEQEAESSGWRKAKR